MVVEACVCDEALGIPHIHLVSWSQENGKFLFHTHPEQFRIIVNWRDVARGFTSLAGV